MAETSHSVSIVLLWQLLALVHHFESTSYTSNVKHYACTYSMLDEPQPVEHNLYSTFVHFSKITTLPVTSRVYNKEEKRVSNALYALCKMFSESHTPGIQTLTNESV